MKARDEKSQAAQIEALGRDLSRAQQIIEALLERIDSAANFEANDISGTRENAYPVFENAAIWYSKVQERTSGYERALTDLANTLGELGAAKEATEGAQRRLRDAIESINEGFAIFDAGDRLVLCHRTYLSLWPAIAEQIVPGIQYADLLKLVGLHDTSLQTSVAPKRWMSERLRRSKKSAAAHVHALADGRWIQIDELRTSEGGIVVVCTDITNVKVEDAHRRARELAEKSALLQATLDTIQVGVCVYDRERNLTAWNGPFLSIIGIANDGVASVSTHDGLLRVCLGVGANADTSPLSWLTGDAPVTVSSWSPDTRRTIEVRRALMPDGGMTVTFDDITYRVQAAASLQEMNEKLELRVQERTADLDALNKQLQSEVGERIAAEAALLDAKLVAERLNVDKTRFLAAVSHDLLQPLNAARLFVTALSNHPVAPASAVLIKQAGSALDSVEDILEALLEISQLDAGAIQPVIAALDLDALLQSLITEFAPFANQRGLTLVSPPSGFWVRTDARLLRRILQNLISNALRYTESGGVRVAVRSRKQRIVVEVHDTGPGIARQYRHLIFKEFSRLAGARRVNGAGLGLAIVERAARMLKHELTLKSRVGEGSVFSIALPVSAPEIRGQLGADDVDGQLTGCKVLAIDNDASSLSAMAALLTEWGCIVETAEDESGAHAALRRLQNAPDLIVADYHLHDGNLGDELLARLFAHAGRPFESVIVTADRDENLRRRLMEKGFRLLTKPVKPGKLRTLIHYLRTSR
jgi:two-component system, sensor histidine kinase